MSTVAEDSGPGGDGLPTRPARFSSARARVSGSLAAATRRFPRRGRPSAGIRATNHGSEPAPKAARAVRHGGVFSSIFSLTLLAVGTFVILLVIAIIITLKDRSGRKIRLLEFELAPAYAAWGYTAGNLPRRILDHIIAMRDSSGSLSSARQVQLQNERGLPALPVEIAGQKVPIMDLAGFLLFFMPDLALNISGELLRSRSSGVLVVRAGNRSKEFPFPLRDSLVPDSVFGAAAEFVLLHADPYILASYYVNTDPARARALFAELIQSQDRRLRAQAFVGQVHLARQTGDTSVSAERQYRLSMAADPAYPGGCVNLAAMYNIRHRDPEALALLESCARGEARWDARAATNKASTLTALGRYDEAVKNAAMAISLEDGFAQRLNMAEALFGMRRYDEALAQLELARALLPEANVVPRFMSLILLLQGKSSDALSSGSGPSDPEFRLSRDVISGLLMGGDSAVSRARGHVASIGSRRVANLLSRLGNWLSIAGRHAEAAALVGEALRLEGGLPSMQWSAGMAACRRGSAGAARTYFERFIQLDMLEHGSPAPRDSSFVCK